VRDKARDSFAEIERLVHRALRFHAPDFFGLRVDCKPCEMQVAGQLRQVKRRPAAAAPPKFCRARLEAVAWCHSAARASQR
jgi:hypothetical protein